MSETTLLEPPTPTAAPRTPALTDLILLRLLPAKKSVAPKALRTDIVVFFRRPPTGEAVDRAVASLRAEGFITPKGQQSTAAGRARALQFLGIDKLPPNVNWGAVKAKYLVPRALGLSPDSGAIRDGKKLAALLLKRRLGLPAGTKTTLNAVFEALACRTLGFAEHTALNDLIPLLLARAINAEAPIDRKDMESAVPRVLLNAGRGGMAGLRGVVFDGWADGEAGGIDPAGPDEFDEAFDLTDFANTVRAAARRCPTGRFGDSKVFISHVWGQLLHEPRFAPLGSDGFKAKLVEANQKRLLDLVPADLNQAFSATDLAASQTTQRNSTYHFISLGGEL